MSNLGDALSDNAERGAARLRGILHSEWVGFVVDWHTGNRDPQPDGAPWPCGCDGSTADFMFCVPSKAHADNRLRRWLFDDAPTTERNNQR